MAQINLSEENLKKLAQSINDSSEPPYDLIEKLFPSFVEKMRQDGKLDAEALNRYKISTLEYAGKRSEGVILASASLLGEAAPLQIIRKFGDCEDEEWKNLIVQGDNLQFLKTVYLNQDPLIKDKVKGKVKLIYIDPPFGTGDEYGGNDGEMSYSAKLKGSEFIENLRERLIFLWEILHRDGVIFVRQGYNFNAYVKIILDEIFGKENFVNEIIVNRGKQRLGGMKKYSTATDTVFFYAKSKDYFFTPFKRTRYLNEAKGSNMLMKGKRNPPERTFIDPEGKKVILLPPSGKHWKFIQTKINLMYEKGLIYLANSQKGLGSGIRKLEMGEEIPVDYVPSFKFDDDKTIDSNWSDISGYSQTTGYPTENSEPLLERIIYSASSRDDIVLDVYAGSGTTGAVAEKLGRRWIMCDFGKHAIYTMQKRMFNILESKTLGEDNNKCRKLTLPFAIVSAGAYDFTRIMDLRNNKEAYISFVLSLFGIPKEDKDYIEKYKLDNIYAEKDGDPVEIFPVWVDEYLYNIRVDEDYLKEIIIQTKGRLKGNYYIVVPETCTLISNTKMNNNSGDEVYFNLLKFPYKILEEASRNFAIEEQPDSPQNINSLVSSVGFYFNDEVEIELIKINEGFKINKFKTVILNKEKQQYEDLEGLSLLLIDFNYNGEIFSMDKAVYQKELKNYGIVEIDSIGPQTAVIAVDKFGNESQPTFITER